MNEPVLRLHRTPPAVLPGGRVKRLRIRHVCKSAYFPHFRWQPTSSSAPLPVRLTADAASGSHLMPGQAPGLPTHIAEQLADLLNPTQWRLGGQPVTDGLHARLQALCAMLTAAIQQAREAWQYVVISWPAWQASLAEDIEFLLEYTVGVFPAWIASLKAVLQKAYIHITSTPQVHQVAMMASNAAKDLSTSLQQLRRAIIETRQLTQRRLADTPPIYQLLKSASAAVTGNSSSSGSNRSIARDLTHSMAALTAADLAAAAPAKKSRSNRRSRVSSTTEDHAQLVKPASSKSQGGFQYELDAVFRNSKEAASTGLQHVIIEPMQHAGFISSDGRSPTVAGVIAAASVLLAGSVYRSMRRNAEAAEERLLQQVQLQMKAESLAAQRARFRRALGDAQAAAAGGAAPSSRRRNATPADTDAWEDNTLTSPLAPSGPATRVAGTPRVTVPQLDADAAREYQRFMAGAKAMDVPMWDSHMVDDLPKVSIKELQRQTQKIRSAATADERAAMEDAELRRLMVEQQLNSQLQELSGAPIGRSAREAWRKEQQQRKVEQQQAPAAKRAGSAGEARSSSRSGVKPSDDSNPFAISKEARAKWDAEDHIFSDKKPTGKGTTGWDLGFSIKPQQQQPQQSVQQQVRRRRFADDGERHVEPAAIQETSNSAPKASALGSVVSPVSNRPQASDHKQGAPVEANTASIAPAGPAEGTPEWEAQMREEMLRSGVARRARRQHLMQQQETSSAGGAAVAPVPEPVQQEPPAQAHGGSAAYAAASSRVPDTSVEPGQTHSVPVQPLPRPKWPGSAAAAGSPRLTVLGRVGMESPSDNNGSGRLSTASARDVQNITAPPAAPSPADMQRLQAAAAGRAEAAAEARAAGSKSAQQQSANAEVAQQDEFNPFAVDKAVVLDDEEAFELGKQVDRETRRIRLEL